MKYEDDLHNCTNERLAEILEANARFEKASIENHYQVVDKTPSKDVLPPALWVEAILEAAARLRERNKVPFNNEAFE